MKNSFGLLSSFGLAILAAGLLTACCGGYPTPCGPAESTCSTQSTTFEKLIVTNKHTKPITVTPIGDFTRPDGSHVTVTFTPASAILGKDDGSMIFFPSSRRVHTINLEMKEETDPSSNTYVIGIGGGITESNVTISRYVTDAYIFDPVNSLHASTGRVGGGSPDDHECGPVERVCVMRGVRLPLPLQIELCSDCDGQECVPVNSHVGEECSGPYPPARSVRLHIGGTWVRVFHCRCKCLRAVIVGEADGRPTVTLIPYDGEPCVFPIDG